MAKPVQALIDEAVEQFRKDITEKLPEWLRVRDARAFRAIELEAHVLTRGLGDSVIAPVLRTIAQDPTFCVEVMEAARADGTMRSGGVRTAKVTLLGGTTVELPAEYVKPNRRTDRRRRRKKRGKSGVGFYPVLAALGVASGVTPALAGEIVRQVADSDSVRAGRAALERRGIDLGHKETLRIVNTFGHRAVEQRNRWLERMREQPAQRGPASGRRVGIATDGGRLRERKQSRKRTAKGRHRFDAPWREPKLLTIYILDEKGKPVKAFKPIYDGSLGDSDAMFAMLLGYLKALGAHEASELICLGDGAKWIWERIDDLATQLGIDAARVTQVIDWGHAVQTLHEIADARATWPEGEKDKWILRAKKHLHAGDIDSLLDMIDALAKGRNANEVSKHRDYFASNRDRMQYEAFEGAGIPIGSGHVESAIRRVINMRLKSNSMYWLEVNAEGMLLLRAYLKAEHFDALVDWSTTNAASWWPPNAAHAAATPFMLEAS